MIELQEHLLINAPQSEVYQWICDIDAYQYWIPYCKKSGVLAVESDFKQEAFIEMGIGPLSDRLVTINTYSPSSSIEMEMLQGPFVFFQGKWILETEERGTKVSLEIKAQMKFQWIEPIALSFVDLYRSELLDAFRRHFFAQIVQ